MKATDIQRMVNQYLAGELLSWKQLVPHLNWALDDVNTLLNSEFPDFSNDPESAYTAFPDRYIRKVIVPGEVYHFYVVDEEGNTGAINFQQDFENNKFYMLRDYSHLIPEEYQSDVLNGTTDSEYEDSQGKRGISGLFVDMEDDW